MIQLMTHESPSQDLRASQRVRILNDIKSRGSHGIQQPTRIRPPA